MNIPGDQKTQVLTVKTVVNIEIDHVEGKSWVEPADRHKCANFDGRRRVSGIYVLQRNSDEPLGKMSGERPIFHDCEWGHYAPFTRYTRNDPRNLMHRCDKPGSV